jgi:hypothetical protein
MLTASLKSDEEKWVLVRIWIAKKNEAGFYLNKLYCQAKCEVESHLNQEADVHREVYEQGKVEEK